MYGKINNGQFSQAPSVVIYQSQKYVNPTDAILEALGYLPVVDDINTKPQSGENINDYTVSYELDAVNNRILKVYTKKPVVLTENNYSTYVGSYVENSVSTYVNEHKSEWMTPIIQPTEGDNLIPQSLTISKTKTTYNQDEVISLNDLTVVCNYTDNTSAAIINYTTNVNEIDTSFAGYKILKVTYVHNGIVVSDKIGIVVNNTDSYNGIQLAYKIAKSGILTDGTPIVSTTEKLIQYGSIHLRLKAKFVVEQNNSTSSVKLGFGDNTTWGTDYVNQYITVNAYEVGEFNLNIDTTIDFDRSSVNADEVILKLHTNSKKIQGYFELQDVSLAYTVAVPTAPISITASKIQTRAIIGEEMVTNDITATVTYNNGTTSNVTPQIIEPNQYNIGDNNITVSYSEASHTVTTTLRITYYAQDKTVADPFTDMTAREWCDTYCHKAINWGNELDSKGNASNTLLGDTKHVGDNYMNQETAWGQPIATLKNFEDIRTAGFDCVRIPVTWCYNSYTEPELDSEGLKVRHMGKFWLCRVREVVDLALEAGLSVMINMHHEQPILFTNSSGIAMKQVYADAHNCWTEIAEKFKHYGHKLMFEGYNEVDNLKASFQFGQEAAEQMNMLNQIFVDAVRATGSNNNKRILACPTTVHMSASIAIDAWEYPTDIAENLIALAVHCYSRQFAQDLSWTFEKMEHYSMSKNVPIMITEWGTTDSDTWAFRAIHAQNYVARAKYHKLYPMWWDNGSDYELVKKYNRINEYNHSFANLQKIIDGINIGYNEMKAYELPTSQIRTWNKVSEFHLLNWSVDKEYYNSGWGYASTDIFPIEPNKKFIFSVDKAGTKVDAVIQLANIVFLKSVYNEELQKYEYLTIETYSPGWHSGRQTGVVPTDANCCIVKLNCPEVSISNAQWETLFAQDGLELSMILYTDADIQEVTLDYRHPTSMILTKDNTVYALNDELATDDINVELVYNDGFVEQLSSNDYIVDVSDVDMSTVGIYDVVVTSNNGGISDVIRIYVGDILMNINSSSQLGCRIGGSVNTTDMVVTATYTDGTSKEVTGYTIDSSDVDTNTTGTYTIHVSYTENGFSATCDVEFLVYDTLEVTNITRYTPTYDGDFLAAGFTKEQPNGFCLETRQAYMYCCFVTDSDYIFADVRDARESNNYHLFIPNVSGQHGGAVLPGEDAIKTKYNYTPINVPQSQAAFYESTIITDTLGREWIKVFVNDTYGASSQNYAGNGKAWIYKSSIPVYFSIESDLGGNLPNMTW